MKIKFENSYWPNAIGVIGVAFAIAFALRGCSNIMVEKEKTKQVKIQHSYERVNNQK